MVVTDIMAVQGKHRNIDNKTYYDWPNTHKIVRDLQPLGCDVQ